MVTKRQLGLAMVGIALLLSVSILLVDALGAGEFRGVGPLQRLALISSGAIFLIGVSLLPLGDRPA